MKRISILIDNVLKGCDKVFVDKANKAIEKAKDKSTDRVVEAINRAGTGGSLSPADEIKKYKELLDMSAITQEEYESKKKQLLSL